MRESFRKLAEACEGFWTLKKPSEDDRKTLVSFLELLGMQNSWHDVEEVASHAILHLHSYKEKEPFYYFWLTSLFEQGHDRGLQAVLQHLRRQEVESRELVLFFQEFPFLNKISVEGKKHSTVFREILFYESILAHKEGEEGPLVVSVKESDLLAKTKTFFASYECTYFSYRNFLRFLLVRGYKKVIPAVHDLFMAKFPHAYESKVAKLMKDYECGEDISAVVEDLARSNPRVFSNLKNLLAKNSKTIKMAG